MKRYEFTIKILDKDYIDSLIVALARQGYAPYITERGEEICITITQEELQILSGE